MKNVFFFPKKEEKITFYPDILIVKNRNVPPKIVKLQDNGKFPVMFSSIMFTFKILFWCHLLADIKDKYQKLYFISAH